MGETVNIAGLDKVEVLRALYAAAKPQGMGYLHFVPGPMSRQEAEDVMAEHDRGTGYVSFDYVKGRVIKVRFSLDSAEFNPDSYDHDNGDGAAFAAIDKLRSVK